MGEQKELENQREQLKSQLEEVERQEEENHENEKKLQSANLILEEMRKKPPLEVKKDLERRKAELEKQLQKPERGLKIKEGQPQVIGPPQPIVAILGDDIILPCHLEPAMDAVAMTLEWTRPDLNPIFVHLWRDGRELLINKNPSYMGRTSLFINKLKHGDISLKLSKVKLSDEGKYRCFIPTLGRDSIVQLVVGAVSSPVIGIIKNSSGVVLGCESKGWYPEPEVFWLDGEGNILSAGPTETVRGPDGLYTVSSRVTVEKTDTNRFTCRVQQQNINQTRETQIHVPGKNVF
uniref:butyrophilin subfamily 1 member A1-like n=1 Tax=Centroberyx gerrardi TaxID=166262 RepID=UPI003AB08C14